MEKDDNTSLRVASFAYYLDTAKENLVQRVSAQETPIPLTPPKLNNTLIKPPISIKFSKPKDAQDNTNLRVDSFSYLNSPGDNFVFEVPGPVHDPTSAFTFSREIPKEGEIGVFNADKYFNMKLEYQTAANKPENLPRIGTVVTPSLCSEASSWNSQTTLLPDLRRTESLTKHKKPFGERIFTGFGCKGPCFSKKSVHINEIVAQGAYHSAKASRINHHLPSIDSISVIGGDQDVAAKIKAEDLDASRPSIEVFGSRKTTSSKGAVATNMERKLSMLTWDAIPKGGRTLNIPSSSSTVCDDMASDASSDLFEIENISGSVYPLTSDMSSCTSHYAPSEASIQWSVFTASAADYSDYREETSGSVAGDATSRKMATNRGSKEGKKTGLLGCTSHKAVNVAETVCFKVNEKVKNQGMDLSASLPKSHVRSRSSINVGLSA